MTFDDFLHTINDFGRYQKIRYIFICLTYMLPAIMVYTWSFAAGKPSFRCKLYDNDTIFNSNIPAIFNESQPDEAYCKGHMKISVKECQRCYRKKISAMGTTQIEPCKEFVFDRKYYEYTLVEEWSMVCGRAIYRSAVQNTFFVGYMVGSIFFGILADKYGRRPIMSICILLMVCTGFLCAFFPQKTTFGFWPSYIVYTIGRFILACSTRGISVTGFVLITELVGPKKKFLTAISVKYFFAIGQLVLVLFAYFIREWRRLTWILSVFIVPFISFHFILPESARWMMSKGHYTKAEKLLQRIAKTNKRSFDKEAFERLKNEQEKIITNQSERIGILGLFRTKVMCIISINLLFQWFVQNLVFYGVSQSTDSWGFDPYLSFTISAIVEILSCVALHPVLNRVGRKLPYFIAALCFAIIALLTIPVQYLTVKDSQSQKILIFIINILLKFFASGSYNIIYIYANELFPTRIRNTGMGVCSMVARIGAIVGTTSNDILVKHHDAQVEWNEIKANEELVREKIEEYLEIYNRLGAPENQGLARPPSPDNHERKDSRGRRRKNTKNNDESADKENDDENEVKEEEEWNGLDDLNDDDDDDEEMEGEKKKKKKKSYYVKKRKPTDEDIIEDPTQLSQTTGGPLEPLPKRLRQPAQERAYKELSAINERIASLVQVRQMGLSTPENKKQLKQLMVDRKKKAYELKRLQSKQRASNKYRNKQKKIVDNLLESKPELHPQLTKLYRRGVGRPRVEEQCPDLLQIIEDIAKVGGASDDRRRSETIRPCLTLDDLREKIKQRGYDIKRTTLYYRLLPHRASSIEGRRHNQTVPVRLRRAQNDEHGKHEDGHFATATIRYMKDLASIFGNDCVFYLSQDDKCKVPLGLPAARVQAPMLMHLDYRIRLPDHDWTVAPRHQLTPSVYAACLLSEDGDLGYSGPTYVAIRSAKHDQSNADSHATDFDRLVNLKEFEKVARDESGQVKPIVICTVDGGPDENPRFPKTLVASIKKFKKYNLDALFVLTHAPGQSAYNIVERRMAPLSHDLAGLILPHDHFGSHLNDSGSTINVDLEKLNFRKAGQILAETWNQTIIDGYPCFAEYVNPPATSDDERRQIDVKYIMDDLLRQVCAEEEAEEGHEFRVSAADEYYQDNARPPREKFGELPKYDIDEYWCAMHVLQTQYTLQIVRCNSIECCGTWRSNYIEVFPHRFLPSPVPFERTPYGIRMAEKDYQKGQFYGSLFQRIQFHGVVIENTQNEMLPFDHCCASVKKELRKRTCRICNQYIPSAYRMKNHYKIHAQLYEDFDHEQDDTLPNTTNDTIHSNQNQPITTAEPPVFKTEMLDWLRSDFDEFDLGPTPTQLASERVIRSMKKLRVEEKNEEDNNQDWVHVE